MEGTALLNRLRHPLRRRPIVAMWAMGQEELSNAECARKGIEAVAGLVMEADIFGVYLVPGANFQTCVEFYYSGTGHVRLHWRVLSQGRHPDHGV